MKTFGPYYADMLLSAIFSHSTRWAKNDPRIKRLLERYDNGEQFFREARTRLNDDLGYGHSRIPAVQTLLLMSAHECSRGHRTQAWLYSGMAFRLVDDMGISIDGRKYAGTAKFSSEDIEIRNRLFWSCYFWDKMISLYLGRPPTIQNSAVSPPQLIS